MVKFYADAAAFLLASVVLDPCKEVPRTYDTADSATQRILLDDFNRGTVGPNWTATGEAPQIEGGALRVEKLRNHPVWLTIPIPDDFRIQLDAWAATEGGDIKLELAGDGKSFDADGGNYLASGYVLIFGGWNNTRHAIARQDEHAQDTVTAEGPAVEPGRHYHFTITREGGDLRWEVDGQLLLEYEDPAPLRGTGHRNLALSGWESEVYFDNLEIEAMVADPG
jgi:hypothetical protein